MNLEDLVADVENTIFDSSVTEDEIIAKINEGLQYTAEVVLLKDLETSGTVTATSGANLVALPTDFSRNLFRVRDAIGTDIQVYSSTALLEDDIDLVDTDGVITATLIEGVAIQAGQLLYGPSPDEDTVLTLRYYTTPTALTSFSQVPDCIPLPHQRNILANYAKWQLFNDIEDGVDGAKVNTQKYEALFFNSLAALEGITTQGQSRPRNREDRRTWF